MRGRALASAVLVVVGISCAKVAPPPGGEIDRDAPAVTESSPGSGAFAVAPDSAFSVTFSEPADRRSVMRALTVIPAVDFAESSWEENTLRLVPENGWAADRPTLIVISGRAKDRRDNEMGSAFRTRFTTRAVPDSGTIAGKVWSGKEVPSGTSLTVAAFEAVEDDSLDPVRQDPWALAEASGGGDFRLVGVDTGRRYHVVAMVDRDGDQRPESSGEPWQAAPEMAVFLSPDEREVR
ncbi:MAG TPA: Ig-like domain-containing protein, partial [bacterium]|nr:Ig-like domain-containing protein [bacterium]